MDEETQYKLTAEIMETFIGMARIRAITSSARYYAENYIPIMDKDDYIIHGTFEIIEILLDMTEDHLREVDEGLLKLSRAAL